MTGRFRRVLAACAVLVVGCGGQPAATGSPAWRKVRDIPLDKGTALTAVSARDARNVFAVGFRDLPDAAATGALPASRHAPVAVRWDGHRWARVTTGLPAGVALSHVAVASATDVWAIASDTPCCGERLYHWDGASWTRKGPSLAGSTGASVRLEAAPDGGAWLIRTGRSAREPVVAYWNGRRWADRPLPAGARQSNVTDIQPGASGEALVILTSTPPHGREGTLRGSRTTVLRWRAGSWHRLALPGDVGTAAITSANEMWAAGITCVKPAVRQVKMDIWERQCEGGTTTWAKRWDGTAWRPSALPPAPPRASFSQISGHAPSPLLLSGQNEGGDPFWHWYDGRRWARASTPSRTCAEIRDVTHIPGTRSFVAVGGGAGSGRACFAATGPARLD